MAKKKKQIPGQLPMFMTARDIMQRYAPLEGDRLSGEDRDNHYTSRRTAGSLPADYPHANTPGGRERALSYGTLKYSLSRSSVIKGGTPETNDEMWDRKLEESEHDRHVRPPRAGQLTQRSHTTAGGANDAHPSTAGFFFRNSDHESLLNSIARTGVHAPVSLGTGVGMSKSPDGRPMILGGHHRVVSADLLHPDQFIPVLHFDSVQEARTNKSYKYT